MNLESDYTNLRKIMELLDKSPRLRRLVITLLAVVVYWRLPDFIIALAQFKAVSA